MFQRILRLLILFFNYRKIRRAQFVMHNKRCRFALLSAGSGASGEPANNPGPMSAEVLASLLRTPAER